MKRAAEDVLQAISISLFAEAVAVTLALATAFVWIAIYSTRAPV